MHTSKNVSLVGSMLFVMMGCAPHSERTTIYEGSSEGAREVIESMQRESLIGQEPISMRKFTDTGVIVVIKKGVPEDNWSYVDQLKNEAAEELMRLRGHEPEFIRVQRVDSIPYP